MKERTRPPAMVVIAISVLPFQKEQLKRLALATERSQSDLAREALSYLFTAYAKLGKLVTK